MANGKPPLQHVLVIMSMMTAILAHCMAAAVAGPVVGRAAKAEGDARQGDGDGGGRAMQALRRQAPAHPRRDPRQETPALSGQLLTTAAPQRICERLSLIFNAIF